MSVLSTLWLVFKGDNKDALAKASETEQANEKVQRSILATSKAGRHATNQFLAMGRSLAGLAVGAFSTASIVAGIKNAADYAQQLDLASRQLHVNVSDLDMWGNAVRRTGGDVKSFESSLTSLAQHLGVTNQTALKLLPTLADAFQKIGVYRSQNYGKTLGLDQSTILLLQQGSREVNRLLERQKELGLVTKRDAEIARNFSWALQDTQHAFRGVWLEVASKLLPVFEKLTDYLLLPVASVFHEHSNLIIGGLIAIGVAAIGAAFAVGLLSLPIVALTASVGILIGLFAIGYDDVKGFFEGQDSLIGRALKQWDSLIDKVKKYLVTLDPSFNHLFGIDQFQGANPAFGDRYLPQNPDDLQLSKNMLNFAAGSNLNPLSSSTILAGQSSANSNVNIDTINVNTQATDADGIAGALQKSISDQLWHANSFVDDGVSA